MDEQINRVWKIIHEAVAEHDTPSGGDAIYSTTLGEDAGRDLLFATHTAIDNITVAMGTTHSFNTAVADMMKLTNTLRDVPAPARRSEEFVDGLRSLVVMLVRAHALSCTRTRVARPCCAPMPYVLVLCAHAFRCRRTRVVCPCLQV